MTGTEATTCASLEFTTGVATGADVVVVVVVELLVVVVSLICVILKTKRFFFSIFVKRERERITKKKNVDSVSFKKSPNEWL